MYLMNRICRIVYSYIRSTECRSVKCRKSGFVYKSGFVHIPDCVRNCILQNHTFSETRAKRVFEKKQDLYANQEKPRFVCKRRIPRKTRIREKTGFVRFHSRNGKSGICANPGIRSRNPESGKTRFRAPGAHGGALLINILSGWDQGALSGTK